jgi:hypothetical protein
MRDPHPPADAQGLGNVFVHKGDAARLAETSPLRENPVLAILPSAEPLAAIGRGFGSNLRARGVAGELYEEIP